MLGLTHEDSGDEPAFENFWADANPGGEFRDLEGNRSKVLFCINTISVRGFLFLTLHAECQYPV